MSKLITLIGACVLYCGCGLARSPEMYRDDTRKLLDGKSAAMKACYDGVLKTDPKAAGKVTVTFAFEKKTGELVDARIDAAHTNAPAAVGNCVVASLRGLTIDPADRQRGEASWTWNFNATQ